MPDGAIAVILGTLLGIVGLALAAMVAVVIALIMRGMEKDDWPTDTRRKRQK